MKKTPFSTTLEFDSLPPLGAARDARRHDGRGRAWRRLTIALAGFWIVAAFAIAAMV